jgi:hypothetical protein
METQKQPSPTMPQAKPLEEHKWLNKLLGQWSYEAEMTMPSDQPMDKCKGVEHVRSVGGLWVLAEGKGEMPGGGEATMIMTIGFDPRRRRFVGTWIGSMMTHMWVYDGELDAARKVLTLNSEGPDMADDTKLARFKDVIEFRGNDQRVLTSHMLGEDGRWQHFMTATYHRKR